MLVREWYTVQGAVRQLEHRLPPRGLAWIGEKIVGIRDRRLTRDDFVALDVEHLSFGRNDGELQGQDGHGGGGQKGHRRAVGGRVRRVPDLGATG